LWEPGTGPRFIGVWERDDRLAAARVGMHDAVAERLLDGSGPAGRLPGMPAAERTSGHALGSFPSFFPPPDARPRGTWQDRWGRRVTAEAVDRRFVHVRNDHQDRVGMGGDGRGNGGATCKIAGIAYTGSNPVPAT